MIKWPRWPVNNSKALITFYTPQEIATDILLQLSLAQIYDALSYYEDHRSQIDAVLQNNNHERWQAYLIERLGAQTTAELLG